MKNVTLSVELSDSEAWQLAQFLKRITWSGIRENACNDDETYIMRDALYKVEKQLHEEGYQPR